MKMAEERDTTNKSKDVLYGGESYNLEMSTQENPKKDDVRRVHYYMQCFCFDCVCYCYCFAQPRTRHLGISSHS